MKISILMDGFRVNGHALTVQLKLKCSQSATNFSPFVTFHSDSTAKQQAVCV